LLSNNLRRRGIDANIKLVEKSMKEIYDMYVKEQNSNLEEQHLQKSSSHGASSSNAICENGEGGRNFFESFLRTTNSVKQLIKSDLDIYLEDSVFIPDKGSEFNALEW
jgi:hypothetical protein